ncbi:MAG TPA: L,D-transpeptidase [Pyrinomonadaceae bacterium]
MSMQRGKLAVVLMLVFALSANAATTGREMAGEEILADETAGAVAVQGRVTSSVRPGRSSSIGTTASDWHESARSDKYTGGTIEKTTLAEGESNIEITVDIPAFRLTLWQDGREVKTYQIGVGMKEYPLVVGERRASEVIWNPSWIPPDSEWVRESGVKPGKVVKPGVAGNPIGKLKIPLGGGYLIHQAKGTGDLGNLVSHGCVRMLQSDLYDLAEKINAAYAWPVSKKRIEAAKRSSKTVVASLAAPMPVDINYDTQVVEGGVLYIYPDVYSRGTNTVSRLRAELETSGVDASRLDDATLEKMLSRPTKKQKFAVEVASLERGNPLADGRLEPLVGQPVRKRTAAKKQRAARR